MFFTSWPVCQILPLGTKVERLTQIGTLNKKAISGIIYYIHSYKTLDAEALQTWKCQWKFLVLTLILLGSDNQFPWWNCATWLGDQQFVGDNSFRVKFFFLLLLLLKQPLIWTSVTWDRTPSSPSLISPNPPFSSAPPPLYQLYLLLLDRILDRTKSRVKIVWLEFSGFTNLWKVSVWSYKLCHIQTYAHNWYIRAWSCYYIKTIWGILHLIKPIIHTALTTTTGNVRLKTFRGWSRLT